MYLSNLELGTVCGNKKGYSSASLGLYMYVDILSNVKCYDHLS